jgi:lysophospholipase L1-like esterase
MINYLWYIICIFGLFIFLLPKKDPFTNKKNIILLGDSLLNNSNYVDSGDSIEDILKSKDPSIISLAQDGSTIEDVFKQLNQIPLHFNRDSYIFLSAGGNDILNADFSQLNINTIFDRYTTLINTIVTKFPYINIISLTLYYPINIKYEKYKDIITIWNAKLKKLMGNTILLTNIIRSPEDIVNNIEPSFIGGQKIANAILQKIVNMN